jgi:Animal haem peroxidase
MTDQMNENPHGEGSRNDDSAGGASAGAANGPVPAKSGYGCPFGFTAGPQPGDGEVWRPVSRRQGVGPLKYVASYSAHFVAQWVNHTLAPYLAPNKAIKESWPWWFMREEDFAGFQQWPGEVPKWRTFPGLLFLIAKLDFIRCGPLTDAYAYKATDTKSYPDGQPESARNTIAVDGKWVTDDGRPDMAASLTRMGSNRPPMLVRPDPEKIQPTARFVGRKLLWRRIDPDTGEPIEIKAQTMSLWGAAHINKQIHGFGGLTMRYRLDYDPIRIARDPKEGWPGNEALIDRTPVDPTRDGYDGRPTMINQRTTAWIMAETYGANDEELAPLRSYVDGKMLLDDDGLLPEDPNRPGADLTGFNNNYHIFLSLLHWLAVKEHNAIADYVKRSHPDWDDEQIFQRARVINIGENALFHTPYWTGDLLQHPVLGAAMDADWWGLLGPRKKLFLMRFIDRHPWVGTLLTPLMYCFVLWGMFGGKWEHHDGPHQTPSAFRLAYRVLHSMWPDIIHMHEAGTDRELARMGLLEIVHEHTREKVKLFGYENIAWTMVTTPCGAPTVRNFPISFTMFHNFQDHALTDLAERDVLRERTDGTGNWNDVRVSLGQHRLESFVEAAGGDEAFAADMAVVFGGNIDAVEGNVGMLAEIKPPGSALGMTQFFEFEKDAPRRGTNNRLFTDLWNYKFFEEGMDWIEHGGGPLAMMARHLPGLKKYMEGVIRPYAPWKDIERFPERLLEKTHADTFKIFKSDLRTFWLAFLALGVSVWLGASVPVLGTITPAIAGAILLALVLSGTGLEVKRMLAMRFMQLCWRICTTDKRGFYFGTLYKGEKWINRAAFLGCLQAWAVLGGFGFLAWGVHGEHVVAAILLGLAGLSGFSTHTLSKKFADDALLLKIALRKRMREGQPKTDASTLEGDTAIQKRYWLLRGNNKHPVATFDSCMQVLQESGLPWWTALGTTIMSLLSMGKKTQRGMTWKQKRANGIGLFFDRTIYLPNIAQALSDSATRVYARPGNDRGLPAGEIDMQEFAYQGDRFSPGRDYFTEYDFERMGEGNHIRDAREGRGNILSRLIGRFAFKRRIDQLIPLFADEVKVEVHTLVPAVTHAEMLRMYDGSAWADLLREHRQGDCDPSPIGRPSELYQLQAMTADDLADVYAESPAGVIRDGDSLGKAVLLPGTLLGRFLSMIANLIWKGKVFDNKTGELPCFLLNKILGMNLIRAKINYGPSWFDGKESIIIDYKETSWLAFFIRDEIRQIQPGLFGGYAYVRLPFGGRVNVAFFALDFRK